MRFCTIIYNGREQAAIQHRGGVLPLAEINRLTSSSFPTDLLEFICYGDVAKLTETAGNLSGAQVLAVDDVVFCPPYRRPRKIFGIGLNYREHAADLDEKSPTEEPASFMKPDTTIIGHREQIILPPQSHRVTAEAELGIVIGKQCKDVEEKEARGVVFGYTTVIDMTAEDILRKNPRFLTRAKSFDTFFSFGPWVVTVDEAPTDLRSVRVSTIVNGEVKATNIVANMTFQPDYLVAFHSRVMTFQPGDLISTGTPGAAVINHGDVVECHVDIDGLGILKNPVTRP